MKKYSVLFVLMGFFLACEQEIKTPEYLLEEAKFVEVLTQLQKAESIVRLGYNRHPDSIYLNDSVYSALFRASEVKRADFDSSMNYYLDHPEQMEGIYDQVLENLSKESAELKAKRKKLPDSPAME